MRKQLAVLLAGLMALSLTACGGGSKPAATTAAPAAPAPAAAETKAAEAAPAAEAPAQAAE